MTTRNAEAIKLFIILNSHKYNSTCVFDIACLFTGLKVLYAASSDLTQRALEYDNSFMNITTSNIRPIYNYMSVLTIPIVHESHDKFKKEIVNIDKFLIVEATPRSSAMVHDINCKAIQKTRNWLSKNLYIYNDNRHKFSPIELTYHSFIGNFYWEYPFEKDETKPMRFYTSEFSSTKVWTMIRKKPTSLLKCNDSKLNCMFVDLPFKGSENSMLIIKPNKIMQKDQLLSFCKEHLSNSNVIINFYNNVTTVTTYGRVYLPKFRIRSKCNLDRNELFIKNSLNRNTAEHGNYLDIIFTYTPHMNNIYSGNNDIFKPNDDTIRLSSNVEMICNENGITSDVRTFEDSSPFHNTFQSGLLINSNFIFVILNKEKRILCMGIFMGENFAENNIPYSPYDIITVQ